MEIFKCFTSTHSGMLIGDNLGEQLTEKRKKLQLLKFPEEVQKKYLPLWTNKMYLQGNVNRVCVNHETRRVLDQICKHMHIPEIKPISRRPRLHTEASKELKLIPSSSEVGLLAPALFVLPAPLSLVPCIFHHELKRHAHEKQSPLRRTYMCSTACLPS